jgi:acyl-CoA synthetase (AMP-forming)/AMP-acid ligase II
VLDTTENEMYKMDKIIDFNTLEKHLCEKFPDKTLVIDANNGFSYTTKTFFIAVAKYRHALFKQGILRNKKIAVITNDMLDYLISFVAICSYGCTFVAISPPMIYGEQINAFIQTIKPNYVISDNFFDTKYNFKQYE